MTIPSSALVRTGGLLFLAATSFGAGSPWLDRLGLDPGWLVSNTASDGQPHAPTSGVEVRSSSDLVLRSPVRATWSSTEIVETFSNHADVGPLRLTAWFQGRTSDLQRPASTNSLALDAPSSGSGTRVGFECASRSTRAGFSGSYADGQKLASGYLVLAGSEASLELGGSLRMERSEMELSTRNGTLDLRWRDVSDSVGARLQARLGMLRWSASGWRGSARSPAQTDLVDTAMAGGWHLGTALPTRFGEWSLGFGRESRSLRTVGSRGDRVFHDQDWNSIRVLGDLAWNDESWMLALSTRQIRLEIPQVGVDHPFVDWNMIPDDLFYRIGTVLENQREYLRGTFLVQRWGAFLDRNWKSGPVAAHTGIGGSWTGIDARVDRTKMVVRMLFPSFKDDTPVDGEGWMATVDLAASLSCSTRRAGTFRAGGTWRQPFAGGWNSALPDRNPTPVRTSPPSNPVDPIGFHEWNVGWTLAL